MKLLSRYTLHIFLRVLLLALGAFVGIYLLIDFFERVGTFVENQAPASLYLIYFANKVPLIVTQVIPMAVLLATFMTVGGLSRSNELTAMRSCGINLWRICTPILGMGLLISLGVLVAGEFLVPLNVQKMNYVMQVQVKGRSQQMLRQENVWFREGGTIVNIGVAYPKKKSLGGVTIFDLDPSFRLQKRTEAPEAYFEGGTWHLKNVTVHRFAPQDNMLTGIDTYAEQALPLQKKPEDFQASDKKNEELGFRQLYALTRKLHDQGYDVTRYRVDMHNRLAAPFVCLIMSFLGIPFALQRGRGASLATGIATSVGIGICFFILQSILTAFGYSGILPPMVSAWAANLLFGLIGVWLLMSTRT